MEQYITELSKYVIAGVMALYTLSCAAALFLRKESKRRLYGWQCALMFLLQVVLFLDLALVSRKMEYVFFYVFVQILLMVESVLVPMIYEDVDKLLLSGMCMLTGIGLCVISRLDFNRAVKQYIIAMISLILALILPYLFQRTKFWKKFSWLYGLLGVAMLSVVLILGEITYGSKLSFTVSFSIAQITFQPSEFVKILFIFFLAGALWEDASLKRVALTAVLAGLHVIVLVLSRDLGSAVIFFIGYVFLVFLATGNALYLLLGAVGGTGGAVAAYRLFAHVRTRVLAWRDPWSYIDNQGYAITQSLFAIGSGSWFGMGLMQGSPDDIPYVMEDFIFSSVCEELGVIFGVCTVLVALCMFLEMMKVAAGMKDGFYRLAIGGVGVMYLFQVFLTVGGGVKLIPLTGVTLPFLSYGGSSIMVSMLLFFIVQGIVIRSTGEQAQRREKRTAEKTASKTVSRKSSEADGKTESKTERKPESKTASKFFPYAIPSVCVLFTGLFLFLLGYLCHFTATSRADMINNSYNSRQEILLSQNYRGTLYSRNGEELAFTKLDGDQQETRVYPYGRLFSHVIGYSTRGRTGIEELANYYLINTGISLNSKVANDMAGLKNPGDNVYTTLDVGLQEQADSLLGLYRGAVIVTEVKTGNVLAMVSHPDFDPNEIADIWDSLAEDPDSSVLVNRATQGLYPPGSTFKMVTALEYIRENPDTYGEYSFHCPGYFKSGDSRINCYHGISHGDVDFTLSFAKSCNASFSNIGMSLDRNDFQDTLDKLLFNESLPIALRSARSSGNVSEDMTDSEMMQTAIGQGKTLITPMHLNLITCAVANDGVLMEPRLLDRVVTAQGKTVKTFDTNVWGRMMSQEEAAALKELMTAVVEQGTASKLKGREYTAAGKTGSAEFNNVKGDSHAWFTGFAPVEDPEVCVTIIIEKAGSGGEYAVPLARRMFDCYFAEKESAETAADSVPDSAAGQ